MPFKADYLATVGVNAATYQNIGSAVGRLQRIYLTARRQCPGIRGNDIGVQLWNQFFAPLPAQIPNLPLVQQAHDDFAKDQILAIAGDLPGPRQHNVGIAQKMFNLFLKDYWALNLLPQAEQFLHIPLDSRILGRSFLNTPQTWRAWTHVVVNDINQQQILADYCSIQQAFRNHWNHVNLVQQRFASPMEMEQFIWSLG